MIAVPYERLTEAGQVKSAPGRLFWLIGSNISNDAKYFILNDATSGTESEVAKFLIPGNQTKVWTFNPPMSLPTGIRIGTIESDKVIVTAGYDA